MVNQSFRWGRLVGAVSIVAGVLVQNASVGATQVQIKPSADLGSVDFNLALDLSGISSRVTTLGALNCTDGGATYGSLFDMEIALAMDSRLRSSINLTCRPVVNISGAVQTVTGTMTIPSKGVTDGVLVAKCSAKAGISVVATAVVGAGVPGLLQLNVSSSSGPVPYGCDFTGTSASKASGIIGTIEGYAAITGMCSSACVSIGLTSTATITSGFGEFAGQTGTGTYTYSDAFEIPDLAATANKIALLQSTERVRDERVYCPEGTEDCSTYNPKPCPGGETECKLPVSQNSLSVSQQMSQQVLLPSVGRPRSLMRVSFRESAGDVVILRPMPLTVTSIARLVGGEPITVKAVPKGSCIVTLSNKAKRVSKSVTLDVNGTGNITYSKVQIKTIAKSLGLVKRGSVLPKAKIIAACKGTTGVLPVRSKVIELAI